MGKELVWQEGTQDSVITHRIRVVDLTEAENREEQELAIEEIEDIADLEDRDREF